MGRICIHSNPMSASRAWPCPKSYQTCRFVIRESLGIPCYIEIVLQFQKLFSKILDLWAAWARLMVPRIPTSWASLPSATRFLGDPGIYLFGTIYKQRWNDVAQWLFFVDLASVHGGHSLQWRICINAYVKFYFFYGSDYHLNVARGISNCTSTLQFVPHEPLVFFVSSLEAQMRLWKSFCPLTIFSLNYTHIIVVPHKVFIIYHCHSNPKM